jgi:uncharacterized OB-fold protein
VSEPVTEIRTPIRLEYEYMAGRVQSDFLRAVAQRQLTGHRCDSCEAVYVPPRGLCPTCGIATSETVNLSDKGTVTTFCVVNLPFYGQSLEIPYVCASVLLDGADVPIFHLIQEMPANDVRIGMRVEAAWVDDEEMTPNLASIKHFRPTGEPDVKPGSKAVAADA